MLVPVRGSVAVYAAQSDLSPTADRIRQWRSDEPPAQTESRPAHLYGLRYRTESRLPSGTCLFRSAYVGQTAHAPEHRFAQHKEGGKLAARKPRKFGLRLRYDLMVGIRRFATRKEAERAEAVLAKCWRSMGTGYFGAEQAPRAFACHRRCARWQIAPSERWVCQK